MLEIYSDNKRSESLSVWGLHGVVVDTGMVWCLLLMVASSYLQAQVLHLQNKQVIVVSTTALSLPPSAQSARLCLCLYSCVLGRRCGVFGGFFFFLIQINLCYFNNSSRFHFGCYIYWRWFKGWICYFCCRTVVTVTFSLRSVMVSAS